MPFQREIAFRAVLLFGGVNVNVNMLGVSKKTFQLELLEKIWPERLEVLVVQLPSNVIGSQSDQHIPACVPLNRCQGGGWAH